jgi:regulator of RNase E activity RraA
MMDEDLLTLLRRVDTPTVLNAIEVVQGKRGFQGFTRGTMVASASSGAAMMGYAVTAQIAGLAPPSEPQATLRARRMAYYRAMYDGPKPSVAVIEDVDHPNCVAAYWGEVNSSIHKSFGMSGALTNGVIRDLGDLPAGFPILAGSVGPSHGFAHIRTLGTPVQVMGLNIAQGDLIHADRHGAVVIPPDIVPFLAVAIGKLQATERIVLDPARRGFTDFAAFEAAWTAFEASRT